MMEQIHEVKSHPHTQLDVIDIGSESYFLLVDDVPTARTQLQLITVLPNPHFTLLLSNYINLFC